MISQYALGRHGWLMGLCFAGFALGSVGVFAALAGTVSSAVGRVGLGFLLVAAVGLAMAARFRMDPPSTTSFSGKMHGISFAIGVPSQVLSVLLLSVALGSWVLIVLAAVIWVSLGIMIAVMVMVGPGKTPDPKGPERFLGLPNRFFMVGYGIWLMAAAWPVAGW